MPFRSTVSPALASVLLALLLAGCGGGGGGGSAKQSPDSNLNPSGTAAGAGASGGSSSQGANPTTTVSASTETPYVIPRPTSDIQCASGAITCVEVISASSSLQASAPVTFGQPFRAGDLLNTESLIARDAAGNTIPLQIDNVSSRSDNSVRFAVLSAQLANLAANERRVINLYKTSQAMSSTVRPSGTGYELDMSMQTFRPQLSRVTFGNRVGYTPGTPFVKGEVVTMRLVGQATEQYSLTIDDRHVGGGHTTLTAIAWDFYNLVLNNANSIYRPIKDGEAGGYENLWLTTKAPGGGAFQVQFTYGGQAVITTTELTPYQSPTTWTASAGTALRQAIANDSKMHLRGAVASEYTLVLPFKNGSNQSHPQLTARLHVRMLDGGARARTDMVIENNWAYNSSPGNALYDITVTRSGSTLLSMSQVQHNHHSRWHKVFWQGSEVMARVRHHMPYFLKTGVVWNYNTTLNISESVLIAEANAVAGATSGPMGTGLLNTQFGTTGWRPEIGPYPRWTALYLITQDERARQSMMLNADVAGNVPIHYRLATTDQPLDLANHPGAHPNPSKGWGSDKVPAMSDSSSVWSPDIAHQGSFAFVPYLITGDAFYLDEVMFWAAYNMMSFDPQYRQDANGNAGLGLINTEQVRGQAWALRSIGEAARAAPDNHALRGYFTSRLLNNINWYNNKYRTGSDVSPLGAIEKPDEAPDCGMNCTGPWQNDFVSIVMGQLVRDGFPELRPAYSFMNNFNIGRFRNEANGFCVAKAPGYYIKIRDASGNFITNWRDLYDRQKVVLNWSANACNASDPVDEGGSANGYAAIAKAMLATGQAVGETGALEAYQTLWNRTPLIDPLYNSEPTWAIVPLAN